MIFEIKDINYVITGNCEKMINLDLLPTTQSSKNFSNMTYITDESKDDVVSAALSSEIAAQNLSAEYMTHRIKQLDESAGQIISVSDLSNTIYALFDIKDVAVKCRTYVENEQSLTHGGNVGIVYSGDLKNIFNSHMDLNPIEFCQAKAEAKGITLGTARFPAMRKTNLLDTRYDRLENGQNSLDWFFKVMSDTNDTYSYIPLSALVLSHLDEDPISTWNDPHGYYYVAKSYGSLSNEILDRFFIPKYNHLSVEMNQLLAVEVEGDPNRARFNDFNNGVVKGTTFIGKNAYDAEYFMNMDSVEDLKHARRYIGIGNVGNKIFLKYYDETNYVKDVDLRLSASSLSSDDLQTVESETRDPDMNSYQNVEVIDSYVGFSGVSAKHKSNLYSIWVKNTGLNVNSDDSLAPYKDKIRHEVANNIRTIAESLAPAHTQLFKVFFKD